MKKIVIYCLSILIIFIISFTAAFFLIEYLQENEYSAMAGALIWHGNRTVPEIALTFDDGPNSKATPQILDILKKYDTKATFFVLGKYIEPNKSLIMREAKEGHTIGNHTYSHIKGNIIDHDKINLEFKKTNELIKKYSGKTPKYFRPPFGYENWRFLTQAELMDYAVILWSLDVGDWNHRKIESEILSPIMKTARNGTIILLHDGGASREAVISALPKIITGLKKKGYKLVTIDEMISHL